MKTTEENFGYQTFVSVPDPGRNEICNEDNQLNVDNAYTYPKKFYDFEDDFHDLRFRLGPADAVYQDPEVVYNDYGLYEDMMTNSVVSRYMNEHYPVLIHPVSGKIAATIDEITRGLDSGVKSRSHSCHVTLKRAMPKYNRYIFSVKSRDGTGTHVVTLKADTRDDRVKKFDKTDMIVSCSCPFWVYYGCEFHAKAEKYLDGSPKGTATYPKERDPTGVNRVCKHVYAVFNYVKGYVYRRDDEKLRGKDKEEVEALPSKGRPERKEVELRGLDRKEKEREKKELEKKELEEKELQEEQLGKEQEIIEEKELKREEKTLEREERKQKEEDRREERRLERETKEQEKKDLLKDVAEELDEESEDLHKNKKEDEEEEEEI